jgi:hypothetical protein
VAGFSLLKNDYPATTFHHAIHHNFTTKNHPLSRIFSKTPLKNAQKAARPQRKTALSGAPLFFLQFA